MQPPGDTAQKRSSPVTPGVLLSLIFLDAVLPHGWPSFACMRGMLEAKYPGQETLGPLALPCAAPWRHPPQCWSPVTPGVLLFRMFFDAVLPHGWPSFACMRGWLGAKYPGQETLCL